MASAAKDPVSRMSIAKLDKSHTSTKAWAPAQYLQPAQSCPPVERFRPPPYAVLVYASQQMVIEAVCGDMDSVRPEVLQYYGSISGTTIYKDPDQYSTDLTKCLRWISSTKGQGRWWPRYLDIKLDYETNGDGHHLEEDSLDVLVLGGLGGRADQSFSLLHHLYSASEDPKIDLGDLYLLTPESIIFLLQKGHNKIHTPVSPDMLGENIGIIPIARPSTITTRGLEWDVEGWETEFGKQISTSNHIRSDHVDVTTTERVLFTVELARK
ncbi:hypothetical protein MMC13_007822 [Lambiella insularis]|nr:hypothetical protein [Lambiella insularis]